MSIHNRRQNKSHEAKLRARVAETARRIRAQRIEDYQDDQDFERQMTRRAVAMERADSQGGNGNAGENGTRIRILDIPPTHNVGPTPKEMVKILQRRGAQLYRLRWGSTQKEKSTKVPCETGNSKWKLNGVFERLQMARMRSNENVPKGRRRRSILSMSRPKFTLHFTSGPRLFSLDVSPTSTIRQVVEEVALAIDSSSNVLRLLSGTTYFADDDRVSDSFVPNDTIDVVKRSPGGTRSQSSASTPSPSAGAPKGFVNTGHWCFAGSFLSFIEADERFCSVILSAGGANARFIRSALNSHRQDGVLKTFIDRMEMTTTLARNGDGDPSDLLHKILSLLPTSSSTAVSIKLSRISQCHGNDEKCLNRVPSEMKEEIRIVEDHSIVPVKGVRWNFESWLSSRMRRSVNEVCRGCVTLDRDGDRTCSVASTRMILKLPDFLCLNMYPFHEGDSITLPLNNVRLRDQEGRIEYEICCVARFFPATRYSADHYICVVRKPDGFYEIDDSRVSRAVMVGNQVENARMVLLRKVPSSSTSGEAARCSTDPTSPLGVPPPSQVATGVDPLISTLTSQKTVRVNGNTAIFKSSSTFSKESELLSSSGWKSSDNSDLGALTPASPQVTAANKRAAPRGQEPESNTKKLKLTSVPSSASSTSHQTKPTTSTSPNPQQAPFVSAQSGLRNCSATPSSSRGPRRSSRNHSNSSPRTSSSTTKDDNKLVEELRFSISEEDDILVILRQLQSRAYVLPEYHHPVKLPQVSQVKPISAIRIIEAIYDAAPPKYKSMVVPRIIQLGEEHRQRFYKVDKLKKANAVASFKKIEETVYELSTEFCDGDDKLTPRLIQPSNTDRFFTLLLHAYYPPPPYKGRSTRRYLYDSGVWTANIWRTFNLHNVSAGIDLYSFETEIPQERSSTAVLKDPTLDKDLAKTLFDVLSKESLSLQLEAFKSGSISNVIGRVVEKEIDKSFKGENGIKMIKTSTPLEITGVKRVLDDGASISHDSGAIDVDFGFVVDDTDSLLSFVLFGDHTSARSAAGGPSSARTWRRSLAQAGFFNLFNELAGGKRITDFDQLCLARQNVPGSDPKAHEFKVEEIHRLDPDVSAKSLRYLESNYGGAVQTHKLMNENPSFTVAEAFKLNGHLMNEAKLAKAIKASGGSQTKEQVQYDSAKTASDAAKAKLSKGFYWDNVGKYFDSSLITQLETASKDSKNKLDQRKAKGKVFTEVVKRKFEESRLPFPMTEEGKPVHNQRYTPEYSNFSDFFLQEYGIRIKIDLNARTSTDPAKDAALRSIVTECDWITGGWVSEDLEPKKGMEVIFILAVISTPIVQLVADSSRQQTTSRKERKKPVEEK
ncbi:hypothetical protein JCM5353_002201 [Sporobolomyces roseus]